MVVHLTIVTLSLLVPTMQTFAETCPPGQVPGDYDSCITPESPTGNITNNPTGNQTTGSNQLVNPLQSQTIQEFLMKIVDVILVFALPIIVLYIIYAGFRLVTARGNESEISAARKALLYAIIGGVIVFGAHLIIGVITSTVNKF